MPHLLYLSLKDIFIYLAHYHHRDIRFRLFFLKRILIWKKNILVSLNNLWPKSSMENTGLNLLCTLSAKWIITIYFSKIIFFVPFKSFPDSFGQLPDRFIILKVCTKCLIPCFLFGFAPLFFWKNFRCAHTLHISKTLLNMHSSAWIFFFKGTSFYGIQVVQKIAIFSMTLKYYRIQKNEGRIAFASKSNLLISSFFEFFT